MLLPIGSWTYPRVMLALFSDVNRAEGEIGHSLPSRTEVKNTWNFSTAFPYILMVFGLPLFGWCLFIFY
jgi:hypothetical protein